VRYNPAFDIETSDRRELMVIASPPLAFLSGLPTFCQAGAQELDRL
jgi:hypothetical protein